MRIYTPRQISLVSLTLLLLMGFGCGDPPRPTIVELDVPGDTANTVGPYQIAASIDGIIDGATVAWRLNNGELREQAMTRVDGRRWVGLLPGAPAGSAVEIAVQISGPGGGDRAPATGYLGFNVIGGDGRCLVDGDCPLGEICDRTEGQCKTPPAVCQDDGDCAQDYVCVTPGEPCRFGPRPRCEGDDDCADGLACVAGQCVAEAECQVDADCGGEGFVCREGECLAVVIEGCEVLGCPDGEICVDNRCIESPVMDCPGGCIDGQICVEGRCVAAPESCGGGCPDGLRCLEPEDRCVACTADGMCPEGAHCDLSTYTCANGPRPMLCAPCDAEGGCGPGLICDDSTFGLLGLCLQPCGEDLACPGGQICDGGICRPDLFCQATECFSDAACESGVCSAGVCEPTQWCEADADCAAAGGVARRCDLGRCVPVTPSCQVGTDCEAGTVCMAGRCVPGQTETACAPCDGLSDCGGTALCAPISEDGLDRCINYCGLGGCPPGMDCLDTGGGAAVCVDPDLGACRGAEDCADDNLEPNDNLGQSTQLGGGAEIRGALCPNNEDWYLLRGRNRNQGVYQLTIAEATGPVSYSLSSSDGRVLDAGELPAGEVTLAGRCGDDARLSLRCERCSARYTLSTERVRCR